MFHRFFAPHLSATSDIIPEPLRNVNSFFTIFLPKKFFEKNKNNNDYYLTNRDRECILGA